MKRNITRRDFLNGVAVTAGAAMMPWHLFAADDLRSRKVARHTIRLRSPDCAAVIPARSMLRTPCAMALSGTAAGTPQDTGETYDLIIVGGGISGLSAAHFYRKSAGANARILILDNHDDFGGHAKRNEFRVGNAFRLGYGGTYLDREPRALQQRSARPDRRAGHRRRLLSQSITTRICISSLGLQSEDLFR